MILGTGTGGGIVVNGRVLDGPNRIAGEWGHNPLPWPQDDERPGPPCYCGRTGASRRSSRGRALARDYAQDGERHAAPEIVARAQRATRRRTATLERYEDRLARALPA